MFKGQEVRQHIVLQQTPASRVGVLTGAFHIVVVALTEHTALRVALRFGAGSGVHMGQESPLALCLQIAEHACLIEQEVPHLRVLQQLACRINGADRGNRFHTAVGLRGIGNITASGAHTENTHTVFIHEAAGGQERYRTADVLGTLKRIFQTTRLAAALALAGCVKGQGHKAFLGQFFGITACGLFFDAACGMAADDTSTLAAHKVIGQIQNTCKGQTVAKKRHIRFHGTTSFQSLYSIELKWYY